MKTAHERKSHDSILVTAAESLGSALGSIAARAGKVQKSVAKHRVVDKLEREGKKIIRRARRAVAKSNPSSKRRTVRKRVTKRANRGRSR